MYSGPIIDPHHHLWDLSMGKHPWLLPTDPSVQAVAGLSEIATDYLVDNYVRDSSGHNIVATVHIEALWAGDPVGETRWLETLDKSKGVAARYVGGASLGKPEAADAIARQAAFDRVTGIRGILSWHPDPKKCFVTDPELGRNPQWRRDIARLQEHGLNLELMMYPYQAGVVREIAEALPGLQIIINHCGSPIDRDPEGMQRWRDGLKHISACPNIAIKISNPGAYDRNWTLESVRDVAMHCIDCFGTGRSMFGTDYPVSKIQMSFNQIYDTFKKIAAVLSPQEQAQLFHDNAKRFYRL
ncbi:amidohydrolase family protein [Mesorhizobium sp. VK25A]|uniref:Amidohydrolase family protein n=1 Tax=Mesorhizobium vachelliae TaxID=3072309 RepID=A0ABU5A8A4_9HYPH|nr:MULTISPECIES: amidohydrolase family protein [unclassified Mesorhizobium]MDX8533939.1 amidohydrolase family protein [Mesorhizobium sp. VK25D]MDX8546590.1 amidohydrolase family protein [Mesorhizobium sp. VK25A]